MKFCIKSFMLIAAAALAFSSCNKEIEEQQIEEQQIVVTNGTHTVNFTAVIGEQSKTTMTEGAEAATFAWSRDDEDLFIVYENNVPGETIGVIDGDIMKLAATFADSAEAPFTYTATLNGKVPGKQTLYDGKYDENSDVLIAEPITSQTTSEDFTFKFNRVVALNKMTLKGLGEDEIVTKVIVKADKDIVGSYDIVNDGWTAPADGSPSTEITIDGGEDEGVLIDNGIAVVYFNCIPVSDTQFTIDVTTDKGEYTKTFSKKITLVEGMLNRFNVAVEKKQEPTGYVKVTSTSNLTDGKYLIVCETASVALDGSLINDVAENTIGVTISDGIIASSPEVDAAAVTYSSSNGSFLGGSGKYLGHTGSSNSLNFSDSALENTVSFDNGNAVIAAGTYVMRYNSASNQNRFRYYTSGQQAIQLYKKDGEPVPPATKYTIIVPDGLTGGTVTSDKDKAEAGETVTITAEPATGYQLSSLTSNVSGEELNGNVLTFTMPEENVTISASFEEIPAVDYSGTYAIMAKRSSGKYWYMTSDLGTASTKRFQAASSEFEKVPETVQVTAEKIWTITKSDNGYVIATSNGKYVSWNSGNSAAISDYEKEMNIIASAKVKDAVIISFSVTDKPDRVLSLNASSGSDYFAFYEGSQVNDLFLVPATSQESTKYELTISSVTGGTISARVDGSPVTSGAMIDEGKTVSITAEPATNYTFESWEVTGADVTSATSATTTFKMNADVTVSAVFTEATYEGSGTEADPYTVDDAIQLIDAGKDLDIPVYVKGYVSKIVTEYSSSFGNISFNVSADGKTTGNQFQFYRNFKGANKTKWEDSDAKPSVGDFVIGYGTLTKYNTTYEFAEGNYIVSLVPAQYLKASADKNNVSADGETVIITVDTNVDEWSVTSDNSAFVVGAKSGNTIPVVVSENTSTTDVREANITVSADGVEDVVITITQAKKTEGGQVLTVHLDGSVLTTTATTEETEKTQDGITYVLSAGAKSQSSTAATNAFTTAPSILIGKNGAYIYNSTSLGKKITGFKIYANAGASAKVSVSVTFGTQKNPEGTAQYSATLSTLNSVYDCSDKIPANANYFVYKVTNANNSQVQFEITYED